MKIQAVVFPRKKIAQLCQRYGVRQLDVFGSLVTGRFTARSDIDILVEYKPEAHPGFLALAGLQIDLSELLGRKVDLVSKKGLKPIIRDEVLATAKVIYAE